MGVLPGPRPGRPARLSRKQIVAAALDGGVETLTMRELAARLGVSHSALYRWVRSLDELFDLISEDIVDRVLPAGQPTAATWRDWLARLAWAMHDEFLAIPGYATRIARPHRHHPASFARLREAVTVAFTAAGAPPDLAAQSWHIFAYGIVTWLGSQQQDHDFGGIQPRFDLFLDTLLRGLPARLPIQNPKRHTRPSGT
jgi:AcrR family transcriptional regulator